MRTQAEHSERGQHLRPEQWEAAGRAVRQLVGQLVTGFQPRDTSIAWEDGEVPTSEDQRAVERP